MYPLCNRTNTVTKQSHSACLENGKAKCFVEEFSVWKFFKFSFVEGKTKTSPWKREKGWNGKVSLELTECAHSVKSIESKELPAGLEVKTNFRMPIRHQVHELKWRNISTYTNSFDPVRTDWTVSRYSSRLKFGCECSDNNKKKPKKTLFCSSLLAWRNTT